MSYPNAIEVCRAELFTKEVELRERYPGQMVEKVLRVREMYNWFIANPDGTDREFVAEVCQRHNIHRTTAYSDLAVVKSLLPMLGSKTEEDAYSKLPGWNSETKAIVRSVKIQVEGINRCD